MRTSRIIQHISPPMDGRARGRGLEQPKGNRMDKPIVSPWSSKTGEEDIFDIALELRNPRFVSREAEDVFWDRYSFDIVVEEEARNGATTFRRIGEMEAWKLDMDAVGRERCDLFSAFDAFEADTTACHALLFSAGERLRKPFRYPDDDDGGYLFGDFHYLHLIKIDERYKGHGAAGMATRIYLEHFAREEDWVYFEAHPLQYAMGEEARRMDRTFPGTLKQCRFKLCRHYERLGFRRIAKTRHFLFKAGRFLSGLDGPDTKRDPPMDGRGRRGGAV